MMRDDLIKRLLSKTPNMIDGHEAMEAAADRIEALEAELIERRAERNHALGVCNAAVEHLRGLEAKLAKAEAELALYRTPSQN